MFCSNTGRLRALAPAWGIVEKRYDPQLTLNIPRRISVTRGVTWSYEHYSRYSRYERYAPNLFSTPTPTVTPVTPETGVTPSNAPRNASFPWPLQASPMLALRGNAPSKARERAKPIAN
jgi:hypothetical protein